MAPDSAAYALLVLLGLALAGSADQLISSVTFAAASQGLRSDGTTGGRGRCFRGILGSAGKLVALGVYPGKPALR